VIGRRDSGTREDGALGNLLSWGPVLLGGRHGQVEGPLGFNGGAIRDTQMVLRSGRTGELFESSSARVQNAACLEGQKN
jgi:hypothetical protein